MSSDLTKEDAISVAEHYEKKAKNLLDQYGDGVRPSWVSYELWFAKQNAAHYRELAEKLTESNK